MRPNFPELKRPSFKEVTLTAAGCSLLLLLLLVTCTLLGYYPETRVRLVFAVGLFWGALCNLVGLRIATDWRHAAVIVLGWGALDAVALLLFDAASSLV